jgi:hypothetical protein
MILGQLAAATLIISVATGSTDDSLLLRRLSMQQRVAAVQNYEKSATSCVAHAIVADARLSRSDPASNLGDLVEASIPKCIVRLRAMIDAYDLYFGVGVGEQFFTGPYLDTLPNSVLKIIEDHADQTESPVP